MTPCRNEVAAKTIEVRTALVGHEGAVGGGLNKLYRRGAFHHDYDVAYAAIALLRGLSTVDELAVKLAHDCIGIDHRCDPVYPPS
jgi:hypothetical protein